MFVAVYSGKTVTSARLVGVSADPDLVAAVVTRIGLGRGPAPAPPTRIDERPARRRRELVATASQPGKEVAR